MISRFSAMDADEFLAVSREEMIEILSELALDPSLESTQALQRFLRVRDSHTYDKHDIPRLVCRALLQKGEHGVKALVQVLPDAPGVIYPAAIVRSLWSASKCETDLDFMNPNFKLEPPLDGALDSATSKSAFLALKELVAEGSDDLRRIPTALVIVMSDRKPTDPESLFDELWDVFLGGHLRINRRVIEAYETLLGEQHSEERYQSFLRDHPVLLDPLAAHVIPKQRLGVEHVTDFVVKRFDGAYLVVEIEKPQDRLFIRKGDFSREFTHAYGQIIDFLTWIEDHKEYAENLMPGIAAPTGLLVMGSSASLSTRESEKLAWLNRNSAAVTVMTFDQIGEKARQLYSNIRIERSTTV